MKRFAIEKQMMLARWKQEKAKHGGDFGNCHCAKGPGTMRKHRPYESHPPSSCRICALRADMQKRENRKRRRMAKNQIQEGLASGQNI